MGDFVTLWPTSSISFSLAVATLNQNFSGFFLKPFSTQDGLFHTTELSDEHQVLPDYHTADNLDLWDHLPFFSHTSICSGSRRTSTSHAISGPYEYPAAQLNTTAQRTWLDQPKPGIRSQKHASWRRGNELCYTHFRMETLPSSPPTRHFCITISNHSPTQVLEVIPMASTPLQVMCLLIVISWSALVEINRQRRLLWSVSVIPTWASTMLLWWFSYIKHLFAQLILVFLLSDTESFVNCSASSFAKLNSTPQQRDLNANICGTPGSRAYHFLSLCISLFFLSERKTKGFPKQQRRLTPSFARDQNLPHCCDLAFSLFTNGWSEPPSSFQFTPLDLNMVVDCSLYII